MAQIYKNASVTLSATWATDPYKGCFVTPDERFIPRTGTFTNSNHETYELRCYERLPELEAPVHDRGWVFQERALSRRIVHFMEKELWWECRESFACECIDEDHRESVFGVAFDLSSRLSEFVSLEDTENHWEEIVTKYTSKSLKYSSDIFPALQGLAKLVPSDMGRYLAGHWENTLVRSLGWKVHYRYHRPSPVKSPDWLAPSWSWASAQEMVSWPARAPGIPYVSVINATTVPEGDDPMGQISSGAIVLHGKCLACKVQKIPSYEIKDRYDLTLAGLDWWRMWTCPQNFIMDDIGQYKDQIRGLAMKIHGPEPNQQPERGIATSQQWLILKPVDSKAEVYTRIGLLDLRTSGFADKNWSIRGPGYNGLDVLFEEVAMEMNVTIV
jgi:hypothetical protein